jgi:hypothetical protein
MMTADEIMAETLGEPTMMLSYIFYPARRPQRAANESAIAGKSDGIGNE